MTLENFLKVSFFLGKTYFFRIPKKEKRRTSRKRRRKKKTTTKKKWLNELYLENLIQKSAFLFIDINMYATDIFFSLSNSSHREI